MLINIIYLHTLLWTLMYILTKICFSFVYLQFFFVLDLKTRKAPITVTGYSARFQTATCGTSSHAFICRNNLSMQRDRPITNGLLTSSRKLEKKKIKKMYAIFYNSRPTNTHLRVKPRWGQKRSSMRCQPEELLTNCESHGLIYFVLLRTRPH